MKKLAMLAAMAVLAAALTACGGNGNTNAGANTASNGASNAANAAGRADGSTVNITASNFKFDQEEYRVKAGDVTIKLHNAEGVHGIKISKTDVNLKGGESQTIALNSPGEYEITCSIACGTGHIKMKAKLVVEA